MFSSSFCNQKLLDPKQIPLSSAYLYYSHHDVSFNFKTYTCNWKHCTTYSPILVVFPLYEKRSDGRFLIIFLQRINIALNVVRMKLLTLQWVINSHIHSHCTKIHFFLLTCVFSVCVCVFTATWRRKKSVASKTTLKSQTI